MNIIQEQYQETLKENLTLQKENERLEKFIVNLQDVHSVEKLEQQNKSYDKLQDAIIFFELGGGYDKHEVIADILGEIKSLKGYSADEIGLEWDGETLTDLENFTDEFYNKIIEAVCNVLKSYQS